MTDMEVERALIAALKRRGFDPNSPLVRAKWPELLRESIKAIARITPAGAHER